MDGTDLVPWTQPRVPWGQITTICATRVMSTKCTPGFACRAFSDTTLVCFMVNEHTTKCSHYNKDLLAVQTLNLTSFESMGCRPRGGLGLLNENPSLLHMRLWWRRPMLVSVKVRLQGPLLKWGPRWSAGVIGGSETTVVPKPYPMTGTMRDGPSKKLIWTLSWNLKYESESDFNIGKVWHTVEPLYNTVHYRRY